MNNLDGNRSTSDRVASHTYDIGSKTQFLTLSGKSKTKYICPVCDGKNLDINPPKYHCFTNECDAKDIRAAIDQLEGKHPDDWKQPSPAQTSEYFYPNRAGESLVKVVRQDNGAGKKKFFQSYWGGQDWKKGNPQGVRPHIPIYRYQEVQKAIEQNQHIYIVEGEKAADALWALGIPATTTIGGSGGYKTYGDYSSDLKGARLILAPDRDNSGLKYVANFQRDFADQIEGYCLAGEIEGWSKPTDGRDLADDILDRHLSKAAILANIISPEQFNGISFSAKPEPTTAAKKQQEPSGSGKFRSSIESGLQIWKEDEDDGQWIDVGNHITAIAEADSVNGGERSLVLEFCDQESDLKTIVFDKGYFFEDGNTSLKRLARENYKLTNRKNKEKLLDYLYTLGQGLPIIRITPVTGWHGRTYVGAIKSYGMDDIRWKDINPPRDEKLPMITGNLADWIKGVAQPSHSNSRAMVAIGMGLAGCLVRILDLESGGLHFWGDSGSGKTTIGKIACSVTGHGKLYQWRSTPNGMEAVFRASNDNLMPMDELTKDMGRYLAEIIYMVNGQGKNRMKRDTSLAGAGDWSLLLFSTGEISSIALMESIGESVKAGQEVRFVDIQAAPIGGLGCFETAHGQDPGDMCLSIEQSCKANSGVALDTFITKLQSIRAEGWEQKQRSIVEALANDLAAEAKTPAIRRIARRFAVIKLALDLACVWDILPWEPADNWWAVHKLFGEWLTGRGGDGSIEIKKACDRIRTTLVTHEFSNRIGKFPDNEGRPTGELLALRVADIDGTTSRLYVHPATFREVLCKGVNHKEVTAELQSRGWLEESDGDGRADRKVKVGQGNKTQRFYIFRSSILHEEEKPIVPTNELGTMKSLGTDS
jgi:putative DNA primase/helicase